MNGLGAAYHVLSVSRHVNTERGAGKVDRSDQIHVAIENHYLRPVMELCAPRSESHDCPVIVRFGADRRPLKRASAGHRIGTEHLGTGHIEQDDLAREPIREIRGKFLRGPLHHRITEPMTKYMIS